MELGRFKKNIECLENDLERFYFCMKHIWEMTVRPESMDSETMRRLFEVTGLESMCKKEREEYDRYMTTERDIRNQNAYEREMAMKEGMKKGMEKGMEKGITDTARNMKKEGIPAEIIERVTGLTVEQIAVL